MKTCTYSQTLLLRFLFVMIGLYFVSADLALAQSAEGGPSEGVPQAPVGPDPMLTRYVVPKSDVNHKQGEGLTWGTAKFNLQEVINELNDYMVKRGLKEGGRIFVKGGTYVPNETTESTGGNVLNTSFKIYEGITIYGGCAGTETKPEQRPMVPDALYGWEFANPTILSGNHTSSAITFRWDETRQEYVAVFPGNSYHVVWFATKGFEEREITEDGQKQTVNRAIGFDSPAGLDGCIIEGGNSSFKSMTEYRHTAYGGGAYMVKNSFLRNCILRKNSATRQGGAVYLDGGGLVDSCYLHTNQCLGIGGYQGYGGAAAIEDDGMIAHTVIVNNVARVGGGLVLSSTHRNPELQANPAAVSCLVANNTAAQEAGGVFFNHGGSVNHLTVVRNRCNGLDITIKDIRYGRSAGAYILGYGHIFNSIFWGGKVAANRDIQMAISHLEESEKSASINYTCFENHDITDWGGAKKSIVVNVEHDNLPPASGDYISNYVDFVNPSPKSLLVNGVEKDLTGVWVTKDASGNDLDYLQNLVEGQVVNWRPASTSAVRNKSVQMIDLYEIEERKNFAHLETYMDVLGQKFTASDEVGAYNAEAIKIAPADITENKVSVKTLFVDPSRKTLKNDAQGRVGNCWDCPLNNLNEALSYFRDQQKTQPNFTGQILVKEGTLNTSGEYYNPHLRSSYIRMVAGVKLKGGYPKELTGTNMVWTDPGDPTIKKQRNPYLYVTRISADLADDDYAFNSCHIITFDNISNAELDGFHLSYANALSGALFEAYSRDGKPQFQNGGGIISWNTQLGKKDYVAQNMTGNKVRNCVISNNSAVQGSGVYVHAEVGTIVELEMENCILHNNRAGVENSEAWDEQNKVVEQRKDLATVYVGIGTIRETHGKQPSTGETRAKLVMNHCDILKNVGHPICTENGAMVELKNSVIWANACKRMANSDALTPTDLLKLGDGVNKDSVKLVSGSDFCVLDSGTPLVVGAQSKANLTLQQSDNNTFPDFNNPTTNIGVTYVDHITHYGGMPDFTPKNMNPMVNAADPASLTAIDMTTMNQRDYGGMPDVGALENTSFKERGMVYYVRAVGGDDANDGLSWATAFKTLQKAVAVTDLIVNGKRGADDKVIPDQKGDGIHREIWMAGGDYVVNGVGKYGLRLRENVDIFGGFAKTGNPGMVKGERDISNKVDAFKTVIKRTDGADSKNRGRVLRGAGEFKTTTSVNKRVVYEGLTITGGHTDVHNYGAGIYLVDNNEMRNCLIQGNVYAPNPTDKMEELFTRPQDYRKILGGGGVYANAGSIIKNCEIRNNEIKFNGQFGKFDYEYVSISEGWRWRWIPSDYQKAGPIFCGAGVFLEDATIINSLVVNNNIELDKLQDRTAVAQPNFSILGAGVYISKPSQIYNCTVAYNHANNLQQNIAYGGVYDSNNQKTTFYNCIFWGNYGNGNGPKDKNFYQVAYPKSNSNADSKMLSNCFYSAVNEANNDRENKYGLIKVQGETDFKTQCDNAAPFDLTTYDLNPYSIDNNSQYCINKGGDVGADALEALGIYVDITGAPRVQDCQIDKGAYEHNGTYAITPENKPENSNQLIFYVTPNGAGVNSGNSVANAACAEKLQLILDAAGRERAKIENDGKEIIVRLAGDKTDQKGVYTGFSYSPRRATMNEGVQSEDPRTWAFIIPRGVTVEGGWDDNFTVRDVENSPTRMSGAYYSGNQVVNVYHTIVFTEKVFKEDETVDGTRSLADPKYSRAILDGVFIEEGQATGDAEKNKYGGAAVVPAFAHVRNCILRENIATLGGGALFLQSGALVSGCLFERNSAKNGGAIYVEEIKTPEDSTTRARIYTSTIVNNTAYKAGGGIYYLNNVRVNSSVFWRNQGNTESNVAGKYEDVDNQYGVEDYPFAFSAVENVRMPGINNLSVATADDNGVRFKDRDADPYYGLTDYSILARTGMPMKDYKYLVKVKQLYPRDFSLNARYEDGVSTPVPAAQGLNDNIFIDMGARSLNKRTVVIPGIGPNNEVRVLSRLFVTHPEKVDMEVVSKMMQYHLDNQGKPMPLNAEKGASFAYPMQSLNDALRYVISARENVDIPFERKQHFEIFVSGGTFYPEVMENGMSGYARANTFLVPEGVAIIGGMSPYDKNNAAGITAEGYLCQNTPDLKDQKGNEIDFGSINDAQGQPIVALKSAPTTAILEARDLYDVNSNNVYEPWELKEQTILSGKNINREQVSEVFHVITVLADSSKVGFLGAGTNWDDVGKKWREPSIVRLDGLQIMDGKAWHDTPQSKSNSHKVRDYTGGGVFASGIFDDNLFSAEKPNAGFNSFEYKYRPIRLKISHCRFLGNQGGLGGALMTDLPADISSCSFEQNTVGSQINEQSRYKDVKGLGSAIYSTNHALISNCLFANNEAYDDLMKGEKDPIYGAGTVALFYMPERKDANGKVILKEIIGRVSMMNCNMVNNKAQKYPAIYTQYPNNDETAAKAEFNNTSLMNTLFWGNEAVAADSAHSYYKHIINFDTKDLTQANEAAWFCAYEAGCGKEPKNTDKKDLRSSDVPYHTPLPQFFIDETLTKQPGETDEQWHMRQRRHCYNANIIISGRNGDLEGPNFTNPSLGAGASKFMVTANWLPFRQNTLTDKGWTVLEQQMSTDKKFHFVVEELVGADGIPYTAPKGAGAYVTFYKVLKDGSKYGNIGVPLGEEPYMRTKDNVVMHRVSIDPNPSHYQTYIDIGLYEYQHVELQVMEDKDKGIDYLWVSSRERPESGLSDGSKWESPTSDLQRAIETLLCHRNGHHKVAYIIEGNYHPGYFFMDENGEKRLAFRINTKDLNNSVMTAQDVAVYGVKSLTLSGGWSSEITETRNIELYPTILDSPNVEGDASNETKYLLDISDAEQYTDKDQDAKAEGYVIPITLEGLTFVNSVRSSVGNPQEQGGAAIYYREQKKDDGSYCDPPTLNDGTKLTIANCKFINNGLNEQMPTVVVDKGGGRALVKNSLFHSNLGASLVARDDASVVNCTFALNGGNVQLEGTTSNLYANVLWKNNNATSFKDFPEFKLAAGATEGASDNAYTKANSAVGQVKNGWILSEDLEDIIYGPNFVNPHAADVMQRDFHLQPSMVLLNKSGADYWKYVQPSLNPLDYDKAFAAETDLAGMPRKYEDKVDYGAYEYQRPLRRDLYADPSMALASGDGSSWEQAYNMFDLQKAVDMAAVYAANNKNKEQAYVFVKARKDGANTEWRVTMREGVSIYGSIPFNFKETAQDVVPYARQIQSQFSGLANPAYKNTVIAGVRTAGNYRRPAVLSGFEITPVPVGAPGAGEEKPAISLINDLTEQAPILVRNSLVHGFDLQRHGLIWLDNGLLYNVLVRDNRVNNGKPQVKLGTHGWLVNNTIVSADGLKLVEDQKAPGHSINNIIGKADLPSFAPYFRPTSGLPADYTSDANLYYQLAERSQYIDPLPAASQQLPAALSPLVNYNADTDLLGNPRKIGKQVDFGCYETWSTKGGALTLDTKAEHYGGQFYPHEGSVVYLDRPMEVAEEVDAFDATAVPYLRPGFLLLQKNGGWYGHGKTRLQLCYVGVERDLVGDNLMALPFDYDYQGTGSYEVKYGDASVDYCPIFQQVVPSAVQFYDRELRAASDYRYAVSNSSCWKDSPGVVPANQGVYYGIPNSVVSTVHRFTQYAPASGFLVYEEDATPKTVELKQANTTALTEGRPDFTIMENMGWNLVGMPYLVSEYYTGTVNGVAKGNPMSLPRICYLLEHSGNYRPMESWEGSAAISAGTAFFTQTAVLRSDVETLTFALPSLKRTGNRATRSCLALIGEQGRDELMVRPSSLSSSLTYAFGADGVKWMSDSEDLPQLYLSNAVGTRFSLASAAPVAAELPLGVRALASGRYTFALPERADFSEYSHVWLNDREKSVVTDLMQEDYVVDVEEALDSPERFTLKFGGTAPVLESAAAARYRVFVRDGVLHVDGLNGGEQIRVYDVSGRSILSSTASSRQFTARLSSGVYVVKVNGNVYKVF